MTAPRDGRTAAVRAQAKLNLSLRVLAREDDGYHQIETVFHRIELHDDVEVQLRPAGERAIACDVDVGPPEENLAFRAAALYCGARGWKTGFSIQITKRIPAGGGLGGGSADAAATLRALNALAPRPLQTLQLAIMGARLGADVPFLCSDAAMALAWGRGERMLALDPLPVRHVALVVPGIAVGTREAYGWLDAAPDRARHSDTHIWHVRALTDWKSIAPLSHNDFTEVVTARAIPQIPAYHDALRAAGAMMADMTGSGSTVFGIFEHEPDLDALRASTGCTVLATRTAQAAAPLDG